MKDEFVSYEIALEMKSIGFDESCFGYYENGVFIFWYSSKQENELKLNCTAPLYQQAFKFFRNVYLLEGLVLPQIQSMLAPTPAYFIAVECYKDEIWEELFNSSNENSLLHYSSYEEAETVCLIKLIEICHKLKQ